MVSADVDQMHGIESDSFDEPWSVKEMITCLRSPNVTVIIAEQYARPLFPILDRGYVLESGSITLSGTGEELLANPHVRAAYFGE